MAVQEPPEVRDVRGCAVPYGPVDPSRSHQFGDTLLHTATDLLQVVAMQPWTLTTDDVLSLSVEELGLRILQDCDANHGRDSFFNFDSWRDSALAAYRDNYAAQRKMVEACNWVRLKGLVAQDPSQSSAAFVFITTGVKGS